MNELHYQLDLMRAMNQKLSDREKMYRLLCDTMDYAYIYYSFEKNSVTTLGKWDDFFDFQIRDRRDLSGCSSPAGYSMRTADLRIRSLWYRISQN